MDGRSVRSLAGLDHADADWAGLRVVVAGLAVSGFAVADVLAQRAATVLAVDNGEGPAQRAHADLLSVLGGTALLGPGMADELPQIDGRAPDVVVTSPGWSPQQPMLVQAAAAGIPIWGDVELAWRLRPQVDPAPWLGITGTNGKTTTVLMLEQILAAAGRRAIAVGNVGTPVLDAVVHPDPYDVLALELSSFQLHWSSSISCLASTVLNVAPDHIDWHGSAEAYRSAKGRIYENTQIACVYNAADPATEDLVRHAGVVDGCRAISFTSGVPDVSQLGVVDGILIDRAFLAERRTHALEICTFDDLANADGGVVAPHTVTNALAAAALARAYGIEPGHIRDGLRGFTPAAHRIQVVAQRGGVRFVDDSKATNGHAAQASLAAFDSIVWIAGGLAKGARFDDLVSTFASRLRAVVLIGEDREPLLDALARHAPGVRVVEIAAPDGEESKLVRGQSVMREAVAAAAGLAGSGDTVLLAPASASMDQFTSYNERGDAFAESVREHVGRV